MAVNEGQELFAPCQVLVYPLDKIGHNGKGNCCRAKHRAKVILDVLLETYRVDLSYMLYCTLEIERFPFVTALLFHKHQKFFQQLYANVAHLKAVARQLIEPIDRGLIVHVVNEPQIALPLIAVREANQSIQKPQCNHAQDRVLSHKCSHFYSKQIVIHKDNSVRDAVNQTETSVLVQGYRAAPDQVMHDVLLADQIVNRAHTT